MISDNAFYLVLVWRSEKLKVSWSLCLSNILFIFCCCSSFISIWKILSQCEQYGYCLSHHYWWYYFDCCYLSLIMICTCIIRTNTQTQSRKRCTHNKVRKQCVAYTVCAYNNMNNIYHRAMNCLAPPFSVIIQYL